MRKSSMLKGIMYQFPCDLYCNQRKIGSFMEFTDLVRKDRIIADELIEFMENNPQQSPYTFRGYNPTDCSSCAKGEYV